MIFKRILIKGLTLCAVIVGTTNAAWTPPSWSYGDGAIAKPPQETSQLGWADDPRWQMLGQSWGAADGVTWAVLDEHGNPGTFGNEDIKAGSQVVFQFDMHKTLYGTHTFDALRAWIDWGNDGFSISDDLVVQNEWDFNLHGYYSDDPSAEWHGNSLYYADKDKSFFSNPITFNDIGDFDLLARVTCSRDLGGGGYPGVPNNWDKLTPTADGQLSQGEAELYVLHVVPVPVPSALLLLGTGLIGVRGIRRRFGRSVV